jgi:hypothetical protein
MAEQQHTGGPSQGRPEGQVDTFSFTYATKHGQRMVAGLMTEREAREMAQALRYWGYTAVVLRRSPFIPALMVTDAIGRTEDIVTEDRPR